MPDYIVEVRFKKDSITRGKQVDSGTRVLASTPSKDWIVTYSVRTTDPASTVAGAVEAGINTLTSPTFAG